MKSLITAVFMFGFCASAYAIDGRQFQDFVGRYQVTGCAVEVNLVPIDKDPYCSAAEVLVAKVSDSEFAITYKLPSGQVLDEGTLTEYSRKSETVEDYAEFRSEPDSAIWFQSFKDKDKNLFIDNKREFWVSPRSGAISLIRSHGTVQDADYKFVRWDFELERITE